jgi:RNA polymerase sigma factor (TIGR02999 family)
LKPRSDGRGSCGSCRAVACCLARDTAPPTLADRLPLLNAARDRKSGHLEPRGADARELWAARWMGTAMDAQHEITDQLLALRGSNDPAVWNRLAPLVYPELRAIAHGQLRRERDGHTLNTTGLVHEAYLRLVNQHGAKWRDRAQFFAVASRVMRRVLIDYARRHLASKRGTAYQWAPFDVTGNSLQNGEGSNEAVVPAHERAQVLIELDEALTRLAALDERLVRVVECRFFAGFTEEETAAALGVTARTVRRDWVKAKGWLQRALEE